MPQSVGNIESSCVDPGGNAKVAGSHILDNATSLFEREARTIVHPAAREKGYLRLENTSFVAGVDPDVAHLYSFKNAEEARASLARTAEFFPLKLTKALPHDKLWKAYCEAINHVVVFVHSRYDRAVIGYSTNEITNKMTGMVIHNWTACYRYVLECCAFGRLPMDIVTLHTATDVPIRKQRPKRKSRALSEEEKEHRKQAREERAAAAWVQERE